MSGFVLISLKVLQIFIVPLIINYNKILNTVLDTTLPN